MKNSGRPEQLPERIRESAEEMFELLYERMKEALDNERVYTAQCPNPKCRGMLKVKYPDVKAMTDAMRLLLEYGFGRPGQQQNPGPAARDLSGKSASELSAAERRLLIERLRERESQRKEGPSGGQGEEAGASGLQGGAEEDPG